MPGIVKIRYLESTLLGHFQDNLFEDITLDIFLKGEQKEQPTSDFVIGVMSLKH